MAAHVPEIAVTDTHPLMWWLGDETRRLGQNARKFFRNVEAGRALVCVPVTALIEISEAVHKGAGFLNGPFDAFLDHLERTPSRYHIVPLTAAIVARSHTLFAIPERGDRLIAATAAELDYPIITRDPAIVDVIGLDHVW